MRLAEVREHVGSTEALLQIVGAMRSLAGMHLHEATRALENVRRYADAMAGALRGALTLVFDERRPATPALPTRDTGRSGNRALLLCTSEHGFVGNFNQRLFQAAGADLTAADLLLVLGSRGAALASERGHKIVWQHPMATRLASISGVVRQAEAQIYALVRRARARRAEVIFARLQPSGGVIVERRRLFPLDLSVDASTSAKLPPLHNLSSTTLLERLTGEYVLAQLTGAITASLASENSARFAAMEVAHDNVARRLQQLRQQASEARQEEITSELLDLLTGELAVATRTGPIAART